MEEMREYLVKAKRRAYRTKERIITRLADKNYHSARAYYMYKLRRDRRRRKGPAVIIYQMGKVGSRTVQCSLEALDLDMPIYHVHFLTQDLIDEYVEKRRVFLGTKRYGRLKHIWLYEYLRKQMDSGLDGRKWRVITLTREPIGRNISEFFENLEVEPLDSAGQWYRVRSDHDFYDFEIKVSVQDMSELVQLFLTRLEHDTPLVFFDQQLRSVLSVDVYSSEFPISKGYQIYDGEIADVLVIRLENLSDCAAGALKEFLGIGEFTLINDNVASEKPCAPLYRKFKESITLPESYVDEMYNSKYMRHFYSEEEITSFKNKWVARTQPDSL
jgi:hypothetical protein